MTLEEAIEYIRTWAKLNRQEVYGSPRDYIDADRLNSLLSDIRDLNAGV